MSAVAGVGPHHFAESGALRGDAASADELPRAGRDSRLRWFLASHGAGLVVLLLLSFAYRVSLIDRGHFFWGDEVRYERAGDLIDDWSRGEYRSAAGRLFESLGRPGFVLISVVPTLGQRWAAGASGIDPRSLEAYDVAALWNVFVSLGVTGAMYALGRRWFGSGWAALLGAVVYSALAQANVWIRHLVPYNEALLLLLMALILLSRMPSNGRTLPSRTLAAGALTAFAIATYPGYYAFLLINAVACAMVYPLRVGRGGAVAVESADALSGVTGRDPVGGSTQRSRSGLVGRRSNASAAVDTSFACARGSDWGGDCSSATVERIARGRLCWVVSALRRVMSAGRQVAFAARRMIGFTIGAGVVVAALECAARFGGTTWIGGVSQFSPTMGLFAEGYVFLWNYLSQAEGPIGVCLFVLLAAGLVRLSGLRSFRRRSASAGDEAKSVTRTAGISPTGRVAILTAMACYLLHASAGVIFHKSVFYGRVLMMYIPFVVLTAVLVLRCIRQRGLRGTAIGCVLAAGAWSFVEFSTSYARLVYPADLWNETRRAHGDSSPARPAEIYGTRDGSPEGILPSGVADAVMVSDALPEGSRSYVELASHEDAATGEAEWIGANIRWMFYIAERDPRFHAPANYALVASAPHPQFFPAMMFEGHRPCERDRLVNRRYTMRVYRRVDAPIDVLASTHARLE